MIRYLRSPFQSTPSVWRATSIRPGVAIPAISISIHALRVEGDYSWHSMPTMTKISIHALRVEGDCGETVTAFAEFYFNPRPPCGGRRRVCRTDTYKDVFQSTPSVWRATEELAVLCLPDSISIHALRVEGDQVVLGKRSRM